MNSDALGKLNKFWINLVVLSPLGPLCENVAIAVGVCGPRHPQKLNTWSWFPNSFVFIHGDTDQVPKALWNALFSQQKAAGACTTAAAGLTWKGWSGSSGRRCSRWSFKGGHSTQKPERATDEQLRWQERPTHSGAQGLLCWHVPSTSGGVTTVTLFDLCRTHFCWP